MRMRPALVRLGVAGLLLLPAVESSAVTRYVANCAPCMGVTYFTLTAAVSAALSGDTIVLQKSVTESPGSIDGKSLEIQGPGPVPILHWTNGTGSHLVTLVNDARLTIRYLNLDCRSNMILYRTNPQQPVSLLGCTLRQSVQVVNSPMISFDSWDAAAPLYLEDCEVIGNGASQASFVRGAGNMTQGPYLVMVNTILRDFNGFQSGPIELYPTTGRTNLFDIRQCTFGNNTIGLLTSNNSTGAVTNTVFSSLAADVTIGTGSRAAFTNCAFERTLGGWNSTCVTISGSSEFVNAAVGDYHLKAGASCIDRGATLVSVTDDKDNNPRPVNGVWDIGAYEYQGDWTPTATSTATFTVSSTSTRTSTSTPTATRTPTWTVTPSPSETPTATATPSPSPTVTNTPTPTETDTATATRTPTWTETYSPSGTPTSTATPTPSATETNTPTQTVSFTPTSTATGTVTATPSSTGTPSFTSTSTPSPTSTRTLTPTLTPFPTHTWTIPPTETSTISPTPTRTATLTSTSTFTSTPETTRTPTTSGPSTPAPDSGGDYVLAANRFDPGADPPLGITFELRESGSVRLDVYSMAGIRVRRFPPLLLPLGIHQARWDGRDERGERVRPGLYLLALRRGDRLDIRRVLVKPR